MSKTHFPDEFFENSHFLRQENKKFTDSSERRVGKFYIFPPQKIEFEKNSSGKWVFDMSAAESLKRLLQRACERTSSNLLDAIGEEG